MELSNPRFLSDIPNRRSFVPNPPFRHSKTSLPPKKNPTSLRKPGLAYFALPSPRASTSEGTNTSISNRFEKVPDEAIHTNFHFERAPDEAINTDGQPEKVPDEEINAEAQIQKEPDELKNTGVAYAEVPDEEINAEAQIQKEPDELKHTGVAYAEVSDEVESTEESSVTTPEAVQTEAIELLDGLNLDYGDSFSILIYGSGALAALWILSAIAGAIDSIALFPKVLEIIGLAYTVWFSYRYLIFKKNRDELSVKIEELKKQIIGSNR